jgi:hypothetical protein
MCYFITVLLPEDADMAKIELICKKYRMDFHQGPCDEGLWDIRPDFVCFNPGLHSHCDCGTCFGDAYYDNYKELSEKGELENKFAELNKIGANIDENYHWEKVLWGDLPLWMGFLRESLEGGLASSIGVVMHWEGGPTPIYPEPIPINSFWDRMRHSFHNNRPIAYETHQIAKEIRKVKLSELSEDILLHIKEEVLYEFYND